MKYSEQEMENKAIYTVAALMLAAAKTAPKERGINSIETLVLDGEDKEKLIEETRRLGQENKEDYFLRDAHSIEQAACVVLIGTTDKYHNVAHCGICGVGNCGNARNLGVLCAFNIGDLGIAVGSAVAVAARHHIDNRIMFSAGKAAISLQYLSKDVPLAYAIPLSVSAKSPFHDRVATK